MKKVQISIDEKLLDRMDTYADDNYLSRSGLITVAVSQYLNAADVTQCIKEMTIAMKKIAETGKVDHETMEQLEDFERLSKMLVIK